MSSRTKESNPQRPLESASTGELLAQFFKQTADLLKTELNLAKAEIRETVKSVVAISIGFLAAAVFGFLGLGLIAAAIVLAMATVLPAWASALIVGVVMLGIAGIVALGAKSKGAKKPLERTQKTLKEDVQWAKERTA